MAWGGNRQGAGAPKGGVSETRRRLIGAIESGVEMAGRLKGIEGNREKVIEETGAHMVCDLIVAGNVRDILAIWGQNVIKDPESQTGGEGKGGLVGALKQASNMLSNPANGSKSVHTIQAPNQDLDLSTNKDEGATDTESHAPINRAPNETMFIPQQSLPLDISPNEASTSQAGATPPNPSSHITHRVESGNLEKNLENSENGNA